MALLIMISFLIIAARSNARLLMDNNLLVDPDSLSALQPNTNALSDGDSNLHTDNGHIEKDMISSSLANSATNEKTLSFRLSPSFPLNYQGESSASNKAIDVNFMVTEQQLSTSTNGPRTGHTKMIRPNSEIGNVDKSHHSNGNEALEPRKSNGDKFKSTPSPGVGN